MRALQPSLLWSLGQIFSFSGNSAAPRGLENSSVLLIGIPGCTWIFHRTKYGYFCHQISNASIFGHKSGHGGADLPVKSTLWTMTVEEQMCWKLLSLIFLSLGKKRGQQWYLEQILLAVGLEKKGIWGFSCCDADWLEVTVLSMYKGVTSYTAECFQALSPGSEGNNSIKTPVGCSGWWSSYGMALRAKFLTRIFQPASSKHHGEDQIHSSFLCQVHENVTKPLSKLQASRLQVSPSSDGTWEVPSRLFCTLWDTCQFSAPAWVPVWLTRKHLSVLCMCWRRECRTSRRGSSGERLLKHSMEWYIQPWP